MCLVIFSLAVFWYVESDVLSISFSVYVVGTLLVFRVLSLVRHFPRLSFCPMSPEDKRFVIAVFLRCEQFMVVIATRSQLTVVYHTV